MNYSDSPDFALGQKIASVLSTPTSFMHDPEAQVAFVSGFVDALHKEANLGPVEIVEVLEKIASYSALEKTADDGDPSFWDKLKGSASGAMVGFKRPDLANAAKNQDWKSLLGKGWDSVKQKVFNPDMLKSIAPYLVSGVGSILAAKAFGLGAPAAAAAGLGGGALGGAAYNNYGELSNLLHRGIGDAASYIENSRPAQLIRSGYNSAQESMGKAVDSAKNTLDAAKSK
jgi:hypothetical protein